MVGLRQLEPVRQLRLVVYASNVTGHFTRLVLVLVTPTPFLRHCRKLMGDGSPCSV